ncbi:MAG: hypothetical protein LC798_20035 [Chloroflexi bacterium]|nr:hypothetical protein [Chloroflexota bacterium]
MKYVVAIVAIVIGVGLIVTGLGNVRTRTSEETGIRRRVNQAAGTSNTYTGWKAAAQGYVRIATGVAAILFGIAFLFIGPNA